MKNQLLIPQKPPSYQPNPNQITRTNTSKNNNNNTGKDLLKHLRKKNKQLERKSDVYKSEIVKLKRRVKKDEKIKILSRIFFK